MAERRPSTSLWAFLRALGGRWFVYMSGPLSVPFTAAAVFVESSWLQTLFALLAATWVFFSCYWVWRQERQRTIVLSERVEVLEERVKPRLVFVIQECCRRQATLGRVGVANPSPVSVEDARVYISVPELQIDDRVLTWAGMGADAGLNIHHGPLSRHAHTEPFLMVGNNPGQFFIKPTYPPMQVVESGRFTAELCVKGRNVTATTARLEFTFAPPHSLTMHLLTDGEPGIAGA